MSTTPFSSAMMAEESYGSTFFSPDNKETIQAGLYHDLNPTKREVRLLRLLPTSLAEVEFELIQPAGLNEYRGSFYAVSYCAGDHYTLDTVKVNNMVFNVFHGLKEALMNISKWYHFAHKSEPKAQSRPPSPILWVDQICINQSNVEERARQVLLMKNIYSSAAETLVWLGTDSASVAGINCSHTILIKFVEELKNTLPLSGPRAVDAAAKWLLELILQGDESIAALPNLLKRYAASWWSRAWIVQEFAMSTRCTFVGPLVELTEFELEFVGKVLDATLKHATTSIRKHPQGQAVDILNQLHHASPAVALFGLRRVWRLRSQTGFPLRQIVAVMRRLGVTDARDHIYSAIGFLMPDHGIMPNYSPKWTREQCYVDAVQRCIEQEKSLEIITDASKLTTSETALPSWVPDFSSPRAAKRFVRMPDDEVMPRFSASKGLCLEYEFGGEERLERRTLWVKVLPLDLELGPQTWKCRCPEQSNRSCLRCQMYDYMGGTDGSVKELTDSEFAQRLTATWQVLGFGMAESTISAIMAFSLPNFPSKSKHLGKTLTQLRSDLIVASHDNPEGLEFESVLSVDELYDFQTLDRVHFNLCRTKNGTLCNLPSDWDEHDLVCVAGGLSVPIVLSKIPGQDIYRLRGPAYIQGYMQGEGCSDAESGARDMKWVEIS